MAYPIYPGMDVKFLVTTDYEDFLLTDDPFEIIIKDRYGRVVKKLAKDDCFFDKDGRFYFTLEKVRRGVYYALFTGDYEDEDYDDQRATVTDIQELLRVPGTVCDCPCSDGGDLLYCNCHKVHYRLVTTASIDGEDYLCGSDGKYILTSDGDRICFKNDNSEKINGMGKVRLDTLTGEQFKQLVEGRTMDGKTNTIPEMIDVLQGINNEETTVKDDVDQQIETGVEQRKASESDIDEIFNKQS